MFRCLFNLLVFSFSVVSIAGVNVRTGNFYLPMQDYFQPCYGYPLEIHRSYNSFFQKDGAFGVGWIFNYDVQVVINRNSEIQVVEADGFITNYEVEETHSNKLEHISRILETRKKEDVKYTGSQKGKGEPFYKRYKAKLMSDSAYFKRQRKRYLGAQKLNSSSGKYISKQRGKSTLNQVKNGFMRTLENGKKEFFNKTGKLVRLEDRSENFLRFFYKNNRLNRIQDNCGQWISIKYAANGKIDSFIDTYGNTVFYNYDKKRRLISVRPAKGVKLQFEYNNNNLLSEVDFGNKQLTHIFYDSKTQKVIKQSGPGKKITTYKYGKKAGVAWAIVKDNQGLNHKYEYLDAKNQIIFTDLSSGEKTITTLMGCCGLPLSIVNAKGLGETFSYDDRHRLKHKINTSGESINFSYDDRFDLPKRITKSDKTFTSYNYNDRGNINFARNSDKKHVKITYEKHGKFASITDEQGTKIVFEYNRIARPKLVAKYDGKRLLASMRMVYNDSGQLQKKIVKPNPEISEQDIKETLQNMLQILKPAGIEFGL